MNGRQFAGAIQPGQLIGIPPVGLYPVGCFLGNQRRRNQIAMNALAAQMTAQHEPARAGFINHAQFHVSLRRLFEQFIHRLECAADDAITTDCGAVLRGDETAVVSLWTSRPI